MANPFEFLQQVRAETAKVVWPTRKETLITTVMVLVFAVLAALFFMFVDWVIQFVMSFILNILR
jgi:preprotein translocase subunit SecE